jgi:hypothetical protein
VETSVEEESVESGDVSSVRTFMVSGSESNKAFSLAFRFYIHDNNLRGRKEESQ